MFWRKKNPDSSPSSSKPVPDLLQLLKNVPPEQRDEILTELAAASRSEAPDILSGFLGMIKVGSDNLLLGWLKELGKAHVFVVSMESEDPRSAFVFGPDGDRNYVAAFTRLELVQSCPELLEKIRFVIAVNGLKLLGICRDTNRGLWINPMNKVCTVQFPPHKIGRIIEEASRDDSGVAPR